MTDSVDVIVVGAGVIGLAVARAFALAGHEVIVVEKNLRAGEETSSRNSGVIHSGIYYPAGSMKARMCVRGRDLLYEYCAARGIAHRRFGKLIVAQQSQIAGLRTLHDKGVKNGVSDLRWLDEQEVRELEPLVKCAAGLWSPSTGIIDVHEYLTALQGDLQAANGTVILDAEFIRADAAKAGFTVSVRSQNDTSAVQCRMLINAAGLHALDLLRRIEGYPPAMLRTPHFARGNYFSCQGVKPFTHLVYPMPNQAGLGVHATLDLDGTTRFGPDVEWSSSLDYRVDPRRGDAFYAAIREYWPGLPAGSLQPAYAGIRPKLVGPDQAAGDFVLETSVHHGCDGLVNLLGIESPGLTSSLAIAEAVQRTAAEKLL